MSHIAVIALFTPRPESRAEVAEILGGMVAPTRDEPGCLQYDLYESDSGFQLFERYEDRDAISAHQATDHYKAYRAAIGDLLVRADRRHCGDAGGCGLGEPSADSLQPSAIQARVIFAPNRRGSYRLSLCHILETAKRPPLGRVEFTAILAMSMATAALAIDLMLPAFAEIRESFGLAEDSTTAAQIITAFFIGMAVAQLAFGPLTDRFGRKPVIYTGFAIYALGGIGAALSPTVPLLLASRVVWGVGAAATRVVSQAVIRDTYEGVEMAKALSYIMTVFILVPVIAPLLGSAIISVVPWQGTAWFAVAFVSALAIWITRLPESLAVEDRLPLRFDRVFASMREVVTTRLTIGTTLGMMFLSGAFFSYLASSEFIIGQIYGRPSAFPFVFAGTAAFMGVGTYTNTRLVTRFGVSRTLRFALAGFVLFSTIVLGVSLATGGLPPFALAIPLLIITLSTYSLTIPNANTLSLLPMGHIAGTAAAVIGTITLTGAALLGSLVDRSFSDTLTPLPLAFAGYGIVGLMLIEWGLRSTSRSTRKPPEPSSVLAEQLLENTCRNSPHRAR